MSILKSSNRLILIAALALLVACESSEERADRHFESAQSLINDGDVDRAIVELRNALRLDEAHRDARLEFANILLDRGDIAGAYRNYLFLVEQSPDDIEALINVAEIALAAQNWEEAQRHTEALNAVAADDPRVVALNAAMAYRQAVLDEDETARLAAMTDVEALVATQPENITLRRILIDGYARSQEEEAALEQVRQAIALEPDNRQLYNMQIALLSSLGDEFELEEALLQLSEQFEDDTEARSAVLRYYLSRERPEDAEAFLRKLAADKPEDATAQVELVQFIARVRGGEAAIAEIDGALDSAANPNLLRALRAGLLFDTGDRTQAISEMEAVIAAAEGDERLNDYRVTLSRMLIAEGNEVGARRLIGEVLENDSGNVEALKQTARWQIDADEPGEAVNTLRTALDNAPQDSQAMTLMAEAYERNGERELSRDLLALAVEASNTSPETSLRYTRVLRANDQNAAAEEVLITALRLAPTNIPLLMALGELYVATEDFPRAEQVEATLRRFGTENATNQADSLRVAILAAQDNTDEVLSFLEGLETQDDNQSAVVLAQARTHLAQGDTAAAVTALEEAAAASPDDPNLSFALASVYGVAGDTDKALAGYRALLDQFPAAESVRLAYIRTLNATGDFDGARAALDEGLEASPNAPNLLWARASVLERDQDYEGAIAIYEQLYEANSRSAVIANNLASLLSTYRDDEASFQRAVVVSRRLRGGEVAAFQDTYGWIAYRQGDYEEALRNLEPAAAGLPNDPLVQYHLGMTYSALGRSDVAISVLKRALEIAGPADTRAQFDLAREEIARLEALPSE